ncbi:hypothetical protein BKA67DRAFT_696258 [Truncatella angustata]|uniref:Uncharacterized protein n=1 Tax=Truncatella angustata TaxID=152316 RepID=A0A9P8UBQ6_9PEZI|nr:uncharacterized protein BKA67DRAFT_696258 [Truncatella angustata]KAH6646397.1 hypothetical protein BKA67DRAFT_696258 [Truncatella angustata]KAH8200028.1 hypothetical protein TruAng_005804 [Truncatella angustata]
MRTRKSNQEKRFHQHAFVALDSSDEEDLRRAAKERNDDSDEGFVDDPANHEPDDEDGLENAELTAASESESDDPVEYKIMSHKGRHRSSLTSGRSQEGAENTVERAPGDVRRYPDEPSMKWTRSYMGPVSRHVHLAQLCGYWFGDRDSYRRIINIFVLLWSPYDLFPPKLIRDKDLAMAKNPWLPQTFWADQQKKLVDWYFNYLSTRQKPSLSQPIQQTNAERWFLPRAETQMTTFLGPYSSQVKQKTKQDQAVALSSNGAPIEKEDTVTEPSGGWMLDVGGIPLSIDWAPRTEAVDQLLALTVIPYSDQAYYQSPDEAPPEGSLKQGNVQIWSIGTRKDDKGIVAFAQSQPYRAAALCFDGWGRAIRIQWCPVPLSVGSTTGLLAFLASDGKVRVVEVKQSWNERGKRSFEEIREPLATLELKGEYNISIISFTWMNMNRIAVGHSDGSVAIWSLYPCVMLQRHPIHSSPVIDIKSGYPSHPFVLATVPTGGVVTITDLSRPNAELAYVPNLMVSFQPGVLAWSEHLRGFVSLWPSSSPSNIAMSFMSVRAWPQSRFVVAISGQPTCAAVGRCHPYLLVGSTDGTLWLSNPFRRVFFHKRKHRKLKVFQHDYQTLPASDGSGQQGDHEIPRGICRILNDFKPLENSHPRHDKSGAQVRQRHDAQKKKEQQKRNKKKKGKGKAKQEAAAEESEGVDVDSDPDEELVGRGTGDVVNCDPLQRISAVAWNPNVEFSWWAAVAMASGLVRVMDLGEEQAARRKQRHGDLGEGEGEDNNEDATVDMEEDIDEEVEDDAFGEEDISADEASDITMEDGF